MLDQIKSKQDQVLIKVKYCFIFRIHNSSEDSKLKCKSLQSHQDSNVWTFYCVVQQFSTFSIKLNIYFKTSNNMYVYFETDTLK